MEHYQIVISSWALMSFCSHPQRKNSLDWLKMLKMKHFWMCVIKCLLPQRLLSQLIYNCRGSDDMEDIW